ncbi:Mitochondrial outer membrane protein iml2 [Rhodotorula kratochvilovae]
MATKAVVLAQIEDATKGFEAILNNDVDGALALLRAQPDSPFHLVGLGIAAFLKAILSREDAELRDATETLLKAETVASSEANTRRPRGDTAGAYPAGIEFKLLTGDAVIGQALVAIMSESYVEFAKAIWKLNKAYKIFMSIYKTVFPGGVTEDESLDSVFRKLNEHYLAQTTAPAAADSTSGGGGGGGFFSSWGRKRAPAVAASLRHSSSSSALAPAHAAAPAPGGASASAPGSHLPSQRGSTTDLAAGLAATSLGGAGGTEGEGDDEHPTPLWAGDRLTTLVISGAALGSGMFGLIFSMLPPKMRKMIAWFGFSGSSRPTALKLLTVAASTGDDVHGYFASLTLVTFYGFILLMSGWQSSESSYLRSLNRTLNRVSTRFPNGTLWVLNRAKLARYERRVDDAVRVIEDALAREKREGNSFREADSLLVFELGWLYLSQAKWVETADSFEKMCDYIAIAAGALIDALNTQRSRGEALSPALISRAEALLARLPALCTQKRVFGEKPVTETFIVRRAAVHEAKKARWVARGRVQEEDGVWTVVRLTNAMELGLFWATIGGRSPPSGAQAQIDLLSSFTPAPRLSSSRAPSVRSNSSTAQRGTYGIDPQTADLDTPAEVLIRDLLLGALYASLAHSAPEAGHLRTAAALLDGVLSASDAEVGEETWARAFAGWHRAVVELKIGDAEAAQEGKDAWGKRARRAEGWLEAVLAMGEFDMKTRLESRVLMLRDEINMRRAKLGLATV